MTTSLAPGSRLGPDQSVTSENGRFVLTYRSDGDLVLEKTYADGSQRALWRTGTAGRPAGRFDVQADGNLVVYGPGNEVVWYPQVPIHAGGRLDLQDDGNLVAYAPSGAAYWATNTVSPIPPAGPPASGSSVEPGQQLMPGAGIFSPNAGTRLVHQSDRMLVVYRTLPSGERRAVWNRGSVGPVGTCLLQRDGNLVVYGPDAEVVWDSGTAGHPDSRLVVQDDGNVVLLSPDQRVVWATGSTGGVAPFGRPAAGNAIEIGETLAPGGAIDSASGEFHFTYQSDGNLVLSRTYGVGTTVPVWDVEQAGHDAGCLILQPDGNLVAYTSTGSAYWATNTAGLRVAQLLLGDGGNLRLTAPSGADVWESNTPRLTRRTRLDTGGEGWDGWVELTITPTGDWVFSGEVENYRPEGIDYRLTVALAAGSRAVVQQRAASLPAGYVVSATTDQWSLRGNDAAVAALYEELERGQAALHADIEVEGDLSDPLLSVLVPVLTFVGGLLLLATPVGLVVGVVVVIGVGIAAEASGGDFSTGLRAAGGVLWMAGPVGMLYAIAAEEAADALDARRELTQPEYDWATAIFGDTLPARTDIKLCAALGMNRREFTFPHWDGSITISLGDAAEDPLGRDPQTFAHELTHVWQIHNSSSRQRWMAHAVATQFCNSAVALSGEADSSYAITDDGLAPWNGYNIEQQARVVEHWCADRDLAAADPGAGAIMNALQHYIDEDVRSRNVGI